MYNTTHISYRDQCTIGIRGGIDRHNMTHYTEKSVESLDSNSRDAFMNKYYNPQCFNEADMILNVLVFSDFYSINIPRA